MADSLNKALDIGRLPKITFVGDRADEEVNLINCEDRVAPLVKILARRFRVGDRVGLLYPSEPMLVLSWLAALHAGLEPLILHVPNAKQNLAAWKTSMSHVVRAVGLAGIICSPAFASVTIASCQVLSLVEPLPERNREPLPALRASASILQMSSGTTGQRKPIRFTLEQIAAHVLDYNKSLLLDADDRLVSWLPLYHDMGFIACFVMPMMLGVRVIMMDPMTWIRNPKRLFQAIQRHNATICYMPNFGFEVSAKHSDGQRFPTMRRWVSCSEPVYPETMGRFAAATGTPSEHLAACYAMAENVFAVAYRAGLKLLDVEGRAVTSCGPVIANTRLKVVDGEIWVHSPSSLTAYLDGAPVIDDGGFYPTGDLGEVVGDELLVIGRKHDVVNVAGKKYMLNDLDRAVGRVMPTLHEGRTAAVAQRNIELGTELPLFLVEDRDFYLQSEVNGMRARLAAEIDIDSFSIEFVPPAFLTKTSSGKINRRITLSNLETSTRWRENFRGAVVAASIEDEFLRLFGAIPRDKSVASLLDSLGIVSLSLIMRDAGLDVQLEKTLQDHIAALNESRVDRGSRAPRQTVEDHVAIVSLADSRTTAGITESHLAMLSDAIGMSVTLEHVCLPPVPVLLSDLVFFDYFLPRDRSEKYDAVTAALSKVRSASLLLIDDVAELLFGQFAYPALDHRFERSSAVDLLAWRWQKYTQHHHELPISIVNLWQTQSLRNEFIHRLSRYVRVPIFRLATLKSLSQLTGQWEYVNRTNDDWTTDLEVDPDAVVARLRTFLQAEKSRIPLRAGLVDRRLKSQDSQHFCSMYVDREKLEDVLGEHQRFCLVGVESSIPYVRNRIRSLGKQYVQTNNLNLRGQGFSDDDFDCVLQVGSWGRVDTARPVFQIFSAGWDPKEQPAKVKGHVIQDIGWFHANPASAPNELAGEKSILWLLSHPESTDRRTWRG